ncbi:MAG: GTPase [Archaeoglobaceae archaeon]|nr:50S ribosome-binding GTPase [Archaeoglobaceae archaeon]MDW7989924.1 GTPase [Archaeoglobaceae archaeon]
MQYLRKIPTVMTAEELLDKIFSKSSKVSGKNTNERIINKLSTISNISRNYFNKIIFSHPNYDSLPTFYKEMIDLIVGIKDLKKSLSSLNWADRMIQKIVTKSIENIRNGKDPIAIFRSACGRISSVIEEIDNDLRFLNEAKQKMREIPSIRKMPTVVVAGSPNVGKSSFVALVSTAKPEIADYPFTTQKIIIGYTPEIQIIDTPGLLDRPLAKRNKFERKAILCLKNAADAILFILDPTETCGYSLSSQLSLLEDIKKSFGKPILEVYSKSDMHNFRDKLAFSAKNGEGIKEVLEEVTKMAKQSYLHTSTVIADSGQTSTQAQHS